MLVVERKRPPVKYIGAAGVHPSVLIERKRGQIDDQPVLYPGHRDKRELAVLVRIDQLSRQDRLTEPLSSSELRCRDVKVLESCAAVRQIGRSSPTQRCAHQIASVDKEDRQASNDHCENTSLPSLPYAGKALYHPAQGNS